MDINQGHYVIYLQNMKFVWLILWPGGACTDNTYATTAAITIPYYDSFHESRLCRFIMAMPNEPKLRVRVDGASLPSKTASLPLRAGAALGGCYMGNTPLSVRHFWGKFSPFTWGWISFPLGRISRGRAPIRPTSSVARLGTKPQIGLLFDTSCAFFWGLLFPTNWATFQFLASCGSPSTMVTQKKLVSHISDFKITGNSVIGQ